MSINSLVMDVIASSNISRRRKYKQKYKQSYNQNYNQTCNNQNTMSSEPTISSTVSPTTITPTTTTVVFVITFENDFGFKWNGETVRTKTGKSGSHMNHIFLTEAFAKNGYNVYLVSKNIENSTYKNVKYLNFDTFFFQLCEYEMKVDYFLLTI